MTMDDFKDDSTYLFLALMLEPQAIMIVFVESETQDPYCKIPKLP